MVYAGVPSPDQQDGFRADSRPSRKEETEVEATAERIPRPPDGGAVAAKLLRSQPKEGCRGSAWQGQGG